MKRMMLWAAGLALVAGAACGADDDAARRAAAEKLLALFKMDETYAQAMQQVSDMTANMIDSQNLPPEAKAEAKAAAQASVKTALDRMSWNKMKGMFVDIYAEVLSLEELQGLVAFYESPIGRKFIAKQPEMLSATMKKMQTLMQEVMPEIQKEVDKQIREKTQKAGGAQPAKPAVPAKPEGAARPGAAQ